MTKSSTRKAAARKARPTHRKKAPKIASAKARATHQHTTKAVAEKSHVQRRKIAPKVTVGEVGDTRRRAATQFEEFRDSQVPDTMHALAESSVAQTREVYERSKNALQAVLESWQKSFGAAGQGATALNHRIIDVAERNINAGFDLATGLAGAKNFADVMASHAAYWRKQIGNLSAQAEEVRALSTKLTAKVADPIKRKDGMDDARRPKFGQR
jgi:hypothetical protein